MIYNYKKTIIIIVMASASKNYKAKLYENKLKSFSEFLNLQKLIFLLNIEDSLCIRKSLATVMMGRALYRFQQKHH